MSAIVRLSCEQVRQVDRRAMEEFGMSGLVLMENAGRGCADVLCRLGIAGPVVIACGKGNNAGDGFVIARHLDLRRFDVRVLLFGEPSSLAGDAAVNFGVIERAELSVEVFTAIDDPRLQAALAGADWVVDALLGTGTRGAPRPPLDWAIERLNAAPARKLAIDLPSGLDADRGLPGTPSFRADHTCTFVAEKFGFGQEAAREYLGEVHVLDIGAPRKLLKDFGLA